MSAVNGYPVITGSTVSGTTITSSMSAVTDADGMSNAVFTYEWLSYNAYDAHTVGTNSPTYTTTNNDVGRHIVLNVKFTDDAGNNELTVSNTLGPITSSAVSSTASTTISEPDRLKVYILQTPNRLKYMDVAGTVISSTGTLRHTGQIEAFNDYNNIPKYPDSEPGSTGGGTGGSGSSVPTGAAVISGPLASTFGPGTEPGHTIEVTNMGAIGSTLTADISGIQVPSGSWTVTYQWYSNSTTVGTNSSTYLVAASDSGHMISVSVNYTDSQGNVTSLGSNTIGPVFLGQTTWLINQPVITGGTTVGSTLDVNVDTTGTGNAIITYQWMRIYAVGGGVQVGTNSPTYTTTNDDIGNKLFVLVSYTDASGNFKLKISPTFGPITS